MAKIALFTTDCAQLADAVAEMAAARDQGLQLSNLGDFLRICRGLSKLDPATPNADRLPAAHVARTAR